MLHMAVDVDLSICRWGSGVYLSVCVSVQPEEEPDPEERDHFLQQLYKFMEDRGETSGMVQLLECGSICSKAPVSKSSLNLLMSVCPSGTPINKPPVLGYKDLNLFKLFRLVYHHGGCHKVSTVSLLVSLSNSSAARRVAS